MTRHCITAADPRWTQLDTVMERYRNVPGGLIPVLHQAQQLFGYLPEEVLDHVATGLDLPASHVYGVVTFYNFFSTEPVGKHRINVCLGTACYVKGAGNILAEITRELGIEPGGITEDGSFSLEVARCVGACSLAPAVVIDGEVFARVTPEQVKGLLVQYREPASTPAAVPATARNASVEVRQS